MLKSYHSNSWNQYYYLKAYHNLGSETQKIMVATFKKRYKRCLTCGDKTHFKKDSPKNTHKKQLKLLKKKKTSRNLPSLP